MTTHYEKSSGKVFADFGMPNSEQELLKAELTAQIFKLERNRSPVTLPVGLSGRHSRVFAGG
jgi:hypothetical protein